MREQKKNIFYIQDWAGNDKTEHYGEFNSFHEAWNAIAIEFQHLNEKEFDEQCGEFVVLVRK